MQALDERIVRLGIHHPPANALTTGGMNLLRTRLEELGERDRPPVVILTAEGERFFCAGGDIKEFVDKGPEAAVERMHGFHRMLGALESYPSAIIAAIQGYAVGGGMELVLFSDHVVAATHAQFGFPEINNGLLPAAKGMRKAIDRLGLRNAESLLYTGRLIDAAQAAAMGLVNTVVPMDQLADQALTVARELAGKDPILFRAIKRSLAAVQGESDQELMARTEADMRSYLAVSDSDEARRRFLTRKG